MYESTTRRRCMAAAIGVLSLGAAGSSVAQSTAIAKDSALREAGQARHEFSIKTEPLRGATFRCGGLTLRATRGRSIETTDAPWVAGIALTARTPRGGEMVRKYTATGLTVDFGRISTAVRSILASIRRSFARGA